MTGMTPGLVHLERDIGRCTAIHPAADHAFGVLNGDPALCLLDQRHEGDDGHPHDQHQDEDDEVVGLQDQLELAGHHGDDLGEDHDRHPVADATVGHQLAQPHDHGGAGRHDDDHRRDREHRRVRNQRRVTARHQVAAAGQCDDAGGLQDGKADGEIPGVLRDLRLTGLALLAQRLQPGDHHGQQLQDDARRDVGHDAEGKDAQLGQRAATEQVDQLQRAG